MTFHHRAQVRHENNDVGDIHICVGDLDTSDAETPRWKSPNQLALTEYNVEVIRNSFNGIANYKQNQVSLIVEHDDEDTSMVAISILVDGEYVGRKTYDLQKFKYCRLSAWCDYGEFELKTSIPINHNNVVDNRIK